MDPLSITASVVTLLEIGKGVVKGLAKLKSYRDAPAELAMLINEVSNFTLILEAIKQYANNIEVEGGEDDGRKALTQHIYLANMLIQEIQETIDAFNQSQENLLHRGWSRLGNRARGFSQRLHNLRDNIHLSLTGLQGNTLKREISSVFLRLDKISTQVGESVQSVQILQDSQRRIEKTIEYFPINILSKKADSAVLEDKFEFKKDGVSSEIILAEELASGLDNIPINTQINQRRQESGVQETAVLITATLGQNNCIRCCPCQCHSPSRLRTPNLLRHLLGSWMLVLRNIALPTTLHCDYSLCRKSRLSSFSLSYYFPKWILARAITVMGNWKDLHGVGVSIVVRIPRIRPFDEPMFRLVENADVAAFRALFSSGGASPFDVTPDGKSCLWRGTIFMSTNKHLWQSYLEICRILINEGADMDAVDLNGYSATNGAFLSMVKLSKSPAAAQIKQVFNIDEFVETKGQGFTLAHRIVTGLSPYLSLEDVLTSDERIIDSFDSEQRSALFYASIAGDARLVELLIHHGANINRADAWNTSPLMAATWVGDPGCVKLLLNAGADVHHRNIWGENAIFWTAQAGQTECAELLLQYGADVDMDQVPYNLGSLLHTVVYYGFADMVDVLIDHGADFEQRDDCGRTAIELVLWWGFGKTGTKLDKIVRRIYERGASLTSLDGFECKSHGTESCSCAELIAELAIQDRKKEVVVKSDSLHFAKQSTASCNPVEGK